MDELISVIIPAYNAENTIQKCLDSVLASEYKNLEIIVVVNNSTDRTFDIVKRYLKIESERIKLHNITTSGVSEARNYGIQNANGRYISFIDSDDYIERSFFKVLISNMRKYDAQLSIVNHTKDKNTQFNHEIYQYNSVEMYHEFFNNKITGYVWDKLFVTELVKQIKFSDKYVIGEDKMFVFSYLLMINKVVITNEILYYYVQVPGSTLNSGYSIKYWDLVKCSMTIERIIEKDYPHILLNAKKECVKECIRFAVMSCINHIYIGEKQEIIQNYIKNNNNIIFMLEIKKSWKIYGWLISINYKLFEFVFTCMRKVNKKYRRERIISSR